MTHRLVTLVTLLCLVVVLPAVADESKSENKNRTKSRGKAPAAASQVAPEREAAVLAFVKEHHPQLNELLRYLRSNDSEQYRRAMSDLYRNVDRLGRIRDRDVEQYEIELSGWRLKSRIELLAAQYKMSPGDPQLEFELRAALAQQVEARRALLQLQRERAAERLKKMDTTINNLRVTKDEQVDQQFRRLTGSGHRAQRKEKQQAKGDAPAAKKPAADKPSKKSSE